MHMVLSFQIVTDFTDSVLNWGYQFTDHVLDLVSFAPQNSSACEKSSPVSFHGASYNDIQSINTIFLSRQVVSGRYVMIHIVPTISWDKQYY